VNSPNWTTTITESVTRVAATLYNYVPTILGSLALLVVGWIVATLLRSLTFQIATRAFERLARTRVVQARLQQSRTYRATPTAISRIVFWGVLLFFFAAAVEVLRLQAVSNVVNVVVAYLPRAFLGIVIVFTGLWVGEYVRAALARTAANVGIAQADAIARIAQALVVFIAIIIAVGQIGIDSTVLVTTLVTVFAATLGAAALAFGLGAHNTVSNIIAAHYVRKAYRVGDSVRIGKQQGRIIEITQIAVLLDTDEGRVMVPTRQFNEEVSVLLSSGD
jgi:small-conductance mechanosensitive channel